MSNHIAKARLKLAEGEKKLMRAQRVFKTLFGNCGLFAKCFNDDEECDIKELFFEAAVLFEHGEAFKEAGDAFLKAAEFLQSKNFRAKDEHDELVYSHEASSYYGRAADAYKKIFNPQLAVNCLLKNTEIYTSMDFFSRAAMNHKLIAELYELDLFDKESSIKHYRKAAELYYGEEYMSSAGKCMQKVGQLLAELGQYRQAIDVLEGVAFYEANHPTCEYFVMECFFQALLYQLCIEPSKTTLVLQKYENASPQFAASKLCKFVKEILVALEKRDKARFKEFIAELNESNKLEPWEASLLVKIEQSVFA